MFAADTYRIRLANYEDIDTLRDLADRNSEQRLDGPVLIGEIDGVGAAALSLSDGHIIADSSRRIDHLVANLRVRAESIWAYESTPSLNDRLLAALPARHRTSEIPTSTTDDGGVAHQNLLVHRYQRKSQKVQQKCGGGQPRRPPRLNRREHQDEPVPRKRPDATRPLLVLS
jgi:hypothetical protein